MEKELVLKNVKVVFADLEDRGFGRNIVIDATDIETREAIAKWVKDKWKHSIISLQLFANKPEEVSSKNDESLSSNIYRT